MRETEIDQERERLEWMEDGGGQIGWVWGWSGVGWWLVATRLATLSKRENKIDVSRMSLILGGSRSRSVLGGSVLGGDNLDGNADKLPAATMMATPISLSLSLSTFLVCKMLFEGKTIMEMVLWVTRGILRSKCKTFSVGAKHTQWCKIFSEIGFYVKQTQPKCSLFSSNKFGDILTFTT